jgi:hypothetical protein
MKRRDFISLLDGAAAGLQPHNKGMERVPLARHVLARARSEALYAHALPHPHQLRDLGHASWLQYRGSEQYPRFQRAVVAACPVSWCLVRHRAISLLSLLCLWLVWSPVSQVDRSRTAALIQGCIWLAFFPAMLVPGTALADPGKQLTQIAGIELNLVGAVGHIVLLATALALLHGNLRR